MEHAARALCLTDVVDSTRLAAGLGEVANAALWDAHDRVARGLVARFGGTELERTDGIMALFDDADAAVAFALAYHEALRGLTPPLRARAGVHVGPVVARPNPAEHVARGAKALEVDGLALAITARVQSVALGGQTLLSASAREALTSPLRVVSHGHWVLKGLDAPSEIFEVGGDHAPFAPPADGAKAYRVIRDGDLWLPAGSVPHALPRERDAFVGRERDLRALAALVEDAALVTVLGIGGAGKTRLVTRYAWSRLGEYPGGAWFCDLADTRDADGIVAAVARTLDVPSGPDTLERVGRAIAGRGRCLFVLDNFEQVARHAPGTLGRWLDVAHEARFVVTTREVLGLAGEATLPLAPLELPDAVALFEARARQAGAAVRDDDRATVAELVRLLDELPLAIELAAARARVMPPKILLERMSQRFRLLAAAGGRHARQTTLRAALDWSWDLLSADEQAALAQLSVFESFTLAAAEAVLELREAWPADAVQGLVDKSLLRPLPDGRMTMLVSVQEYAAERLGAGRDAAEARHGAYYATFGSADRDWPDTPEAFAARWAVWPEVGNLLAACRRAVDRGDAGVAAGTLAAVIPLVGERGDLSVALPLANGVLGLRDALSPADRVRATRAVAMVRRHCRIPGVASLYDEGIARARDLSLLRDAAALLNGRAIVAWWAGDLAFAREALTEAITLCKSAGYLAGEAQGTSHLGVLELASGNAPGAIPTLRAAMAQARRAGDENLETVTGGNLGGALVEAGRAEEAAAVIERTLSVMRSRGLRAGQAVTLINLSILRLAQGRLDASREAASGAVEICKATGDREMRANASVVLCAVGGLTAAFDEGRAAAREALALWDELGSPGGRGDALVELADLERRAGDVGRATALLAEGVELSRRYSRQEAIGSGLCVQVALSLAQGDRPAAERALAEVSALAAELGVGAGTLLGNRIATAEAAVRAPERIRTP
jgi:predicted ATPase/class 3 adenylate cyclase